MTLLGILRLANALDEPHDRKVTDISVEVQNGGLKILARGLQEFSSTAQRVARARYLLESMCKRPILISSAPVRAVRRRVRIGNRRQSAAAAR